jgi:hypothetical protein
LIVLEAVVFLGAAPAIGQPDIEIERVEFAPGAVAAIREGSITGYEVIDYLLWTRAGQYANVSMATSNTASYFNILAPGETEVAMFNGSVSENQYEGILPTSGDYRIRVYMMRSAARRGEVARYRLEMIVTDVPDKPSTTEDTLVPGTDFHATGSIPCALRAGDPSGSCPFGVMREGGGSGMVVVTKPDGRTRAIFFENGEAIGADVSEADPGEFHSAREADTTIVRIGDERYEIPDAVLRGG